VSEYSPVEKSQAQLQRAKQAQSASKSKVMVWLTFLLVLLILLVLSAGGIVGYQHHQKLRIELAQLKLNQAATAATLTEKTQQLAKTQQAMMRVQQQLQEQQESNARELEQLASANQQDWLLAEAEYLLRLANQRLHLERDWNSALSMLQAADNVLSETHNPRTKAVRAAIAKEILALKQIPAVDKEGAVLRLQALQDAIPKLPWVRSHLTAQPQDQEMPEAAPVPEQAWYQRFWHKLTGALASLVRVRERDSANNAPLSPDQQYYLQQNMYLMLEQAQVALLREEPSLYLHSLVRVEHWIKQYLLVDDAQTASVQKSLTEMKAWQVNPTRPDISESLLQLQKLVEQQRRGSVPGGAS
jgi:uroporphyrin-3 C-methyltransferase